MNPGGTQTLNPVAPQFDLTQSDQGVVAADPVATQTDLPEEMTRPELVTMSEPNESAMTEPELNTANIVDMDQSLPPDVPTPIAAVDQQPPIQPQATAPIEVPVESSSQTRIEPQVQPETNNQPVANAAPIETERQPFAAEAQPQPLSFSDEMTPYVEQTYSPVVEQYQANENLPKLDSLPGSRAELPDETLNTNSAADAVNNSSEELFAADAPANNGNSVPGSSSSQANADGSLPQPPAMPPVPQPTGSGNGNKGLRAIIIIVVVLLIVGLVAWFVFGRKSNNSSNSNNNSNSSNSSQSQSSNSSNSSSSNDQSGSSGGSSGANDSSGTMNGMSMPNSSSQSSGATSSNSSQTPASSGSSQSSGSSSGSSSLPSTGASPSAAQSSSPPTPNTGWPEGMPLPPGWNS